MFTLIKNKFAGKLAEAFSFCSLEFTQVKAMLQGTTFSCNLQCKNDDWKINIASCRGGVTLRNIYFFVTCNAPAGKCFKLFHLTRSHVFRNVAES